MAKRKPTQPDLLPETLTPKAPTGKIAILVGLMERPGGATAAELMAATGWQAHSVRGAIAGSIKKTLGLAVLSEKTDAGRTYRIQTGAVA